MWPSDPQSSSPTQTHWQRQDQETLCGNAGTARHRHCEEKKRRRRRRKKKKEEEGRRRKKKKKEEGRKKKEEEEEEEEEEEKEKEMSHEPSLSSIKSK